MDIRHLIGALIALALSTWASFSFFRGGITGASPLYSKGWLQRGLHLRRGFSEIACLTTVEFWVPCSRFDWYLATDRGQGIMTAVTFHPS